jgi:cytochrome bd-type quinol oxidase subunit 2
MSRVRPDIEYVKGYSIALLCLGLFLLLGALQLSLESHGAGHSPALAFTAGVLCLLGVPCLVVSLLRWLRLAAALPATAALSYFLLLGFPLGTFLSVYWLKKVRSKELALQDQLHPAWFSYTVVLYILGLLLLDMALVLRLVQSPPGSEIHMLEMLRLGGVGVALAAIATGAWLSTRKSE